MQKLIQSLPLEVFLVMLGLATAFVAIPLYASFRARQNARALASVSAVPIADAEDGYIRIEGVAERPEAAPLRAPLTEAECVWYRARVEDSHDQYGKSQSTTQWRAIKDDESDALIAVSDASGVMLIDPTGAEVTPSDRSLWYGATPIPEDRNPRKFGAGENPKGEGLQIEWSINGSRRYRYTEERIYAGNPIFVQGELAEREDLDDDADVVDNDGDHGAAAKPVCVYPCMQRLGDRPYLISTTAPAVMADVYQMGSAGAQVIAAMFAMGLVALLWLRFS